MWSRYGDGAETIVALVIVKFRQIGLDLKEVRGCWPWLSVLERLKRPPPPKDEGGPDRKGHRGPGGGCVRLHRVHAGRPLLVKQDCHKCESMISQRRESLLLL